MLSTQFWPQNQAWTFLQMKHYSINPTCLFQILDVSSPKAYGMHFRHVDKIQGIKHKTYIGIADTARKYYTGNKI